MVKIYQNSTRYSTLFPIRNSICKRISILFTYPIDKLSKETTLSINEKIKEISSYLQTLTQEQKQSLLSELDDISEFNSLRRLFLDEQREKTFDAIEETGATCPNCGQHAEMYKKTIPSSSAVFLCSLVKKIEETNEPAIHFNDCKYFHRGYADLQYWDLAHTFKSKDSKDSKKWTGYWRPTKKGIDFAKGNISVPKYIHVYNNQVVHVEKIGEKISIYDALRDRLSFVEKSIGFDFETDLILPRQKLGLIQMSIPFID